MAYSFSGILVRYKRGEPKSKATSAAELQVQDAADGSGTGPVVDETPVGQSNESPVQDELHVNLWEVGKERMLDLGIMIHQFDRLTHVLVDLPWTPLQSDVVDLGARLNSEKMVAAIFNEIVQYKGAADQAYAEISFRKMSSAEPEAIKTRESSRSFHIIRLNNKNFNIDQIPSASGTSSSQLHIEIPQSLRDDDISCIYMRFRIRGIPEEAYSSVFRQRDRNLLSSSSETRIVDFRINVRRGVPDEILSDTEKMFFPQFKKIHFFLTVDRTQTCEFESKHFEGCRSLVGEDEWAEYIRKGARSAANDPDPLRNYLGYQWTAKYKPKQDGNESPRGVKDLVVLGRFTRNQSDLIQIIRFMIIVLMFGMIGSAVWSVIDPVNPEDVLFSRIGGKQESLRLIAASLGLALLLIFLKIENLTSWCARKFQSCLRFIGKTWKRLSNMSR